MKSTVEKAQPFDRDLTHGTIRILHLEDEPHDAELVESALSAAGFLCQVTRVVTERDFTSSLQEGDFDLILADYSLPSFDGKAALAIAREAAPDVPFLFLSGTLGEEVAIESLKMGATDYAIKDRLSRLRLPVKSSLPKSHT